MRVLTKREKEAFEAAWIFMERVGGLYARNGEPERYVENVVVLGKGGAVDSLPPKVKAAVYRMGGLNAVNAYFNGMTKAKNFDKFVSALMRRREQPREYWADGTLHYDEHGQFAPQAVEIVYEERTT